MFHNNIHKRMKAIVAKDSPGSMEHSYQRMFNHSSVELMNPRDTIEFSKTFYLLLLKISDISSDFNSMDDWNEKKY